MARNENPPFQRGETFHNGTPTADEITAYSHLEGKEWIFEDIDYTASGVSGGPGSKRLRSGRLVRCRIVRNKAGFAVLPKRLVSLKAGTLAGQIDGYADVTAEKSYPVDEWLPSTGVPTDDLFWIVVEGPATVLTDLAGGANNVITQDDRLVSLTAATSGATTAGRVRTIDLSGATTPLADNIMHCIGKAMSAKTTANTNADVLVDIGEW